MAKTAIVRLTQGNSQTSRGRNFTKGNPQTITNVADIKYFEDSGWFSVQIVTEEKKAAPADSSKKTADAALASSTQKDDADKEEEVDDDAADEDEDVVVEMLTQSQLENMTKKQLVDVGEVRLVLLSGQEKKAEMVSQILEAQDQLAEQEEDEDDEEDEEE